MFALRRFSHKVVTLQESKTASNRKLPLFEDSEKARLLTGYFPSRPPKHSTKHKKLCFVSKLLLLVVTVAFAFYYGQSIRDYATLGYKALLRSNNALDHVACGHNISTDRSISTSASPWAGPPVGAKLLNRTGWDTKCSSSKDSGHDCKFAFDDDDKYWQSANDPRDHWVEIDLNRSVIMHSLAVKPSLLYKHIGGSVRKHRVEIAAKKGSWDLVA